MENQSPYDEERLQMFLKMVESERERVRVKVTVEERVAGEEPGTRPGPELTATAIARIWWGLFFPPHRFHQNIGKYAYEAIDMRETIMAIASALGGPERLPAPLDSLWEPLGVAEWELERLLSLESWQGAGRAIELAAAGMAPSIWPFASGWRRVDRFVEGLDEAGLFGESRSGT